MMSFIMVLPQLVTYSYCCWIRASEYFQYIYSHPTAMILPLQEIFSTTWSAAQAAISVMLVLGYGYYARKLKILSRPGEENSSHLCVTLFLPCLLFAEIGPLSSWSNLKHCKLRSITLEEKGKLSNAL